MVATDSRWNLKGWKKGKVALFDAFGLHGATYPQLQPRLVSAAAANSVPLSTFAPQAQTTQGSQTNVTGPVNTAGFKKPIGPGLTPSRIDQGVDFSGKGPLYALGSGTITSVYNSGWPGGVFIGLKLDGTNRYVYYAEDVSPQVRVNQRVTAGQLIGYATGGPSGIEVGWAAPPGTGQAQASAAGQTKAGQSKGDPGYYSTAFGENFNAILVKLGVKSGRTDPPVQGSVPGNW